MRDAEAAGARGGTVEVVIQKPVYGGDFLGSIEGGGERTGKAVFVPFGLPGEIVAGRIFEEKKSFAKAELERVIVPSTSRVEPRCTYFGSCGGCQYQHADYPTQLRLKKEILAETLARAGVRVPGEIRVLAGEPWGYRNRIRLAVAIKAEGRVEIGYRGRRSHDLVAIGECPIAAPVLVAAGLRIAGFLESRVGVEISLGVSEIELFTNSDETQLLVTLFIEPGWVAEEHWLGGLGEALGAGIEIAGIRVQVADGSLSPRVVASLGAGSLSYRVAGLDYEVDQGAFFQVNHWLVDEFVGLVTGGVEPGELAWDLFAGVGLFARQLAGRFKRVDAVESAPASLGALGRNLAGTDPKAQAPWRAVGSTSLEFLRRNRLERGARPDFIVMDPPRAGLGEETTRLLAQIHAPRMVYVSCDPVTLARDLKWLTAERFQVDAVTMVDMFPQTFHLETVVVLSRR